MIIMYYNYVTCSGETEQVARQAFLYIDRNALNQLLYQLVKNSMHCWFLPNKNLVAPTCSISPEQVTYYRPNVQGVPEK